MSRLTRLFTTAISVAVITASASANATFDREGKNYMDLNIGWGGSATKRSAVAKSNVNTTVISQTSKDTQGTTISAGFGTYILKELRGGIGLVYASDQKSKTTPTVGAANVVDLNGNTIFAANSQIFEKNSQQVMGGFLEGYYDLLNGTNAIPFVGLGYGMLRTEITEKYYNSANVTAQAKKTNTRQAAKLAIGLAYHATQAMDITLSYHMHMRGLNKRHDLLLPNGATYFKVKYDTLKFMNLGVRYTF